MRSETRFWLLACRRKRDELVVRTRRVRITNTLRFWRIGRFCTNWRKLCPTWRRGGGSGPMRHRTVTCL